MKTKHLSDTKDIDNMLTEYIIIELNCVNLILSNMDHVHFYSTVAELHAFNGPFYYAWASSNNFNCWSQRDHPGMEHFHTGYV